MELKQWQNIFHVTVNANSMVQYVIQYKNGTIKYVNVNTKIFISAKKIIVGILAEVFICENGKYLKSVVDTSVTEFDQTVIVIDNLSTKNTNTIETNFTITVYINCHSKKVRDCYISHTVLLVIILPLIITVICYHYAKQKGII